MVEFYLMEVGLQTSTLFSERNRLRTLEEAQSGDGAQFNMPLLAAIARGLFFSCVLWILLVAGIHKVYMMVAGLK
jgi:hypothetical protein